MAMQIPLVFLFLSLSALTLPVKPVLFIFTTIAVFDYTPSCTFVTYYGSIGYKQRISIIEIIIIIIIYTYIHIYVCIIVITRYTFPLQCNRIPSAAAAHSMQLYAFNDAHSQRCTVCVCERARVCMRFRP